VLTTEGPDVCDYKTRLRELDSDLNAYYDQVQEEWVITWWNEKKNQEEFVLARDDLIVAYNAVVAARNDAPGAETADAMHRRLIKEQEQLREDDMDDFREISGDAAERLLHAFKKDGILDHENIYGPKAKPHLARRDVRIREP
jgi:hypothetical protein